MPVIARFSRQNRKRGRRRRRLRTVAALPTLMTLTNLLCGFAAIHFCMRAIEGDTPIPRLMSSPVLVHLQERVLPSFLAIGAVFVFIGLVFDALDGSVARLTNRTSDFGGQLDSMADVVTFGVAPAMLVITVIDSRTELAGLAGPLSGDLVGRAMWMMAAVYVACAAMRLARFNVEHAQTETAHKSFSGLPSPGAAVVIASLVLLYEHLEIHQRVYLAQAMPVIAMLLGLLMVSRIRYVHMANAYLTGKRPFSHVVALLFLLAVFWWYKEITLAVVVCAYASSGPLGAVWRRMRRRARRQAVHRSSDSSRSSGTESWRGDDAAAADDRDNSDRQAGAQNRTA